MTIKIKINGLILDGNGENFVGITMYCAACGEEMPSFQKGGVACQKCGGEEWHSINPHAPTASKVGK